MHNLKENGYTGLVYEVAVPTPLRRVFDYLPVSPNEKLKSGSRVLVPFGKRCVVGFVISSKTSSSLVLSKLKPIAKDLDKNPILPNKLLKLLLWSARYYQHPIGEVLNAAIPKKIRSPNSIRPSYKFWKVTSYTSGESLAVLRNAPKQKALFELLQSQTGLTKEKINNAGFDTSTIKELKKKHLITEYEVIEPPTKEFAPLPEKNSKSLDLNKQQQRAFDAVTGVAKKFTCFLLDGVTGSGKTEVYMHTMQQKLCKGQQCLVLVPEIGLTPQTLAVFRKRFECPVVSIHSGLTDTERLTAWNEAKDGTVGILIGTRSSVFTPFANLGIIVVDEEHDSSFKQQEGFKYSARDIAIMRAREEKIPIILGSATPSLESLQNTIAKKFVHLCLDHRAGGAVASSKTIVDTANQNLDNGFSEQLLYKIEQHLASKKQVLVFINRRGFAPTLTCQKCGWVAECENCDSQMTMHINPPSIRCHHCGIVTKLPGKCPQCHNTKLEPLGIGTQKLEYFLQSRFQSIPVFRVDRDSTRSKFFFQSMLDKINTGESCLLLGTQMIAKGHHFPNITLVAIVNADMGLFSPDFRGQEQMAQTITQVSGRAGRASQLGEVVIQSRHASHTILQNLVNSSYNDFATVLLHERRIADMPPFSQLAIIKAQGKRLDTALNFLKKVSVLSGEINSQFNYQVNSIGPIPSPIEKRAGMFRSQIILKTKKKSTLQQFMLILVSKIETLRTPSGVRWSIDIDPVELM
ncbi:primosomal protein N' [Gammaproteobacteria bacterium]|nr:primosomal protein N' [Gammaproteobacteria bacterium]